MNRLETFLLALAVLALLPALALAQPPPVPPVGPSDLDIIDRELANRPPEPRSLPPLAVTEDEAGATVFDGSLTFTLAGLEISGATVFTPEELLAPYRDLIGTTVSFADVVRIRDELTVRYREAGYLLSKVALPAQRLDPAFPVVRLLALEGYIEAVEWSGDPLLAPRAEAWFSGQQSRLLAQRPLRYDDFERAVTLMADVHGCEVSTRFSPGTQPSGSILHVEVTFRRIDGSLSLNNASNPSSGPWMAGLTLNLSNMPLFGSQLELSYNQAVETKEYLSFRLTHTHRFASGWWTTVSAGFSESLEPDSEFARTFEQNNRSRSLSLGAGYNAIRGRRTNLSLELGYAQRDAEDFLLGDRYTTDHLRSLSFTANFDFSDEGGGVTQIIPSVVQGLDLFSATDRNPDSSAPLAPASFSKATLYLSHGRPLFGGLGVHLSAQLQLAGTTLPSYEEFSLGGGGFGKGYRSGALSSDNGFGAAFELRYTASPSPAVSIQPYAFVDGGAVWTSGRIDGVDPHEELSSAGVGLRLMGRPNVLFPRTMSLNAFVGKPLKTVNRESSPRWILMANVTF